MAKKKMGELPDPPKIKLAPPGVTPKRRPLYRPWTDEEIAFLRKNYATLGPRACAARLKRSYSSVYTKAWELGCTRKQKRRPSLSRKKERASFLQRLRRILGR